MRRAGDMVKAPHARFTRLSHARSARSRPRRGERPPLLQAVALNRRRADRAGSARAPARPEPRSRSGACRAATSRPPARVIWSRSDRPSRMVVEWSTSPAFTSPRRVLGPAATEGGDLIAKVALEGLPSSTRIHYRVRFEAERASDWLAGALSTPDALGDTARASSPSDVVFAWSGDTNGQGWGIDPARGGMPAFTALLDRAPDFFISCGDAIYADNPIPPEIELPGGGTWKNLVTPAKSHIAETLDDFRGAHLYPRLSREVRALSAAVPAFNIWDDHEVRNNWFPGEVVVEPARREPRMSVIAEHARQAMLEHWPTLVDPSRMYRSVRWGPLLEVFFLDGRSFRTPNHPVPRDGGVPRSGAARVARGRARGVDRDLEGDRLRHADRARRVRAGAREAGARRVRRIREHERSAVGPRARARASARLAPGARRAQRGVAHGRRPLRRRSSLHAGARGASRHRSVLGVRRGADARDVVSAKALRRHVRARARLRVGRLGHVRLTRDRRAVLRRRADRRPLARDDGHARRRPRPRSARDRAAARDVAERVAQARARPVARGDLDRDPTASCSFARHPRGDPPRSHLAISAAISAFCRERRGSSGDRHGRCKGRPM